MSAFDDLHAQLSQSVRDRANAAAPDAAPAPTRSRRPHWWTTRPFVLALVGLSVAGTATAATVAALSGTPSAPLEGRVDIVPPGSPVGPSKQFERYRVTLAPEYRLGQAGWCLTTRLAAVQKGQYVALSGCGEVVPAGDPVIASDLGNSFTDVGSDEKQNTNVAIVDERIGGVRTGDGRVYTPRTDPDLPDGFRVVVIPRPGQGDLTVLDAEGRRSKAYDDRPPTPDRTQPGDLALVDPSSARSPTDPPENAWGLRSATDDVRVIASRELAAPPAPLQDVHGRPFLVVADARLRYRGRPYRVAHLVDGANPSARAPQLPGTRGGRLLGTFEVRGNSTSQPPVTYRRSGAGLIVVRGPGAAGREAVVAAMRLGPVPTSAPTPGALGPPAAGRP